MREIKFRGLNGETGWHYGIPLTNKLGTYIIFEKNPHICSQYHYIEIDEFEVVKKETVSQWTGLLDKNDVEIYEGDIVKFQHIDDYGYMTNVFQNGFYRGVVKWGGYYPAFDIFDIKDNSTFDFDCNIFSMESDIVIEVIGNIYENKELLGQI